MGRAPLGKRVFLTQFVLAPFVFCCLGLSFPQSASAEDLLLGRPVAQGIQLKQILRYHSSEQLIINMAEIDLKQVKVTSALAGDYVEEGGPNQGREWLTQLARRKGFTLAVNADYFSYSGDPLGLMISNGELVSEPHPDRVAIGFTSKGQVLFDKVKWIARGTSNQRSFSLQGLNRKRGSNELILYTPRYGPSTQTNDFGTEVLLSSVNTRTYLGEWSGTVTSIFNGRGNTPLMEGTVVLSGHGSSEDLLKTLQPGDTVHFRITLQPTEWAEVVEAVGGGPWLVRGGKIVLNYSSEKFDAYLALRRHPRTAIGINKEGHLMVVTVDGRQTISAGMTLSEFAQLLVELGAENAINLDGGGSTGLVAYGCFLNSPSELKERPIANALGFTALPLSFASSLPEVSLSPAEVTVVSGQTVSLELRSAQGEKVLQEVPVLWSVDRPIGFISQQGRFTGIHSGMGTIIARLGNQLLQAKVTVVPGPPAEIQVMADLAYPPKGRFIARVTDANRNPVPGVEVTFDLGKEIPPYQGKTDLEGQVVYLLSKEVSPDTKIRITAPGLAPVTWVSPPRSQGRNVKEDRGLMRR